MTSKMYARNQVGQFIMSRTGVSFMEFPDSSTVEDWIEDDMTEKQVDEIIPDLAWEILDNSGMDRDTVDRLCYPEEYDNEEE